MKIQNFLLAFLFATVLIACASLSSVEVGRIHIDKISNLTNPDWKSATLNLTAGDKLWFWTDIYMEYEGNVKLEYEIQLIKDKDTLGFIQVNPLNTKITIGEVKTTLLNKTKWGFQGSMDFLQIKETGKYTFRTILASNNNETLKLTRADLVLKK